MKFYKKARWSRDKTSRTPAGDALAPDRREPNPRRKSISRVRRREELDPPVDHQPPELMAFPLGLTRDGAIPDLLEFVQNPSIQRNV